MLLRIIKKILKYFLPYGLIILYKKYKNITVLNSPSPITNQILHKNYGNIYLPNYNFSVPLNSNYPEIYNKDGQRIELFFIRDVHESHYVYSNSKYFDFDRYNFGLKTHFYTHNTMLETMGNPDRKYGWLLESEIIVPNDYKIFKNYQGLEKDFDLIFTYSEEILSSIDNSRYFPNYIQSLYGNQEYFPFWIQSFRKNTNVIIDNGILSVDNYKYKTKNISIIASDKLYVPLHKFRSDIARECKIKKIADTFGTFDNGSYCDLSEPLKDYRFSIVIENEITSYGFTEKITNCFGSMTIPVYLGATKIDNLFNPDGIIQFNINDDIETILKKCTKKYYEERISAIIDNFNIVKNNNGRDLMYENYIRKDIGKVTPEEFFKMLRTNS